MRSVSEGSCVLRSDGDSFGCSRTRNEFCRCSAGSTLGSGGGAPVFPLVATDSLLCDPLAVSCLRGDPCIIIGKCLCGIKGSGPSADANTLVSDVIIMSPNISVSKFVGVPSPDPRFGHSVCWHNHLASLTAQKWTDVGGVNGAGV
jgi:hypothetical protein